jgi:hypothetical protein
MRKRLGSLIFLGALASMAYTLAVRPRLLYWGARDDETQRALLGDDRVPQPMYETTRAITIRASAARVWQWLVQIGVGRGGFYTYDALENVAGLGIHSADRIRPEWQTLRIGDAIHISPVTPLKIAVLEPNRALVLHIVMSPFTAEIVDANDPATRAFFDWTWAFVLDEPAPMMTRLIVRVRGNYKPDTLRFAAPIILEPIHFLMERGMLQGIKRRAEQSVEQTLATRVP